MYILLKFVNKAILGGEKEMAPNYIKFSRSLDTNKILLLNNLTNLESIPAYTSSQQQTLTFLGL